MDPPIRSRPEVRRDGPGAVATTGRDRATRRGGTTERDGRGERDGAAGHDGTARDAPPRTRAAAPTARRRAARKRALPRGRDPDRRDRGRDRAPRARRRPRLSVGAAHVSQPADGGERHVRIYEVGPRDGLQNEAGAITLEAKQRYVELLLAAGLRDIEATSFVSP